MDLQITSFLRRVGFRNGVSILSDSPAIEGIVVVVDEKVSEDLRQIARRHGMSLVQAATADQAFRDIVRLGPKVVILQIPKLVAETLALIRMVATAPHPVPIIAAATLHTDKIEKAVRRAGATYYVPSTEQPLMKKVLRALLLQQK